MNPVDATPNAEELRAAVHQIVTRTVDLAGEVPPVGSQAWWDAPPLARLAGLLVLAEHWLLRSPDELAADQLKAASAAVSTGRDWTAAARAYQPHAELVARRAEPGPLARPFDAEAAARWVATGSSSEAAA